MCATAQTSWRRYNDWRSVSGCAAANGSEKISARLIVNRKERQQLAFALYQQTGNLATVAQQIKNSNGFKQYDERHVAYDLWAVTHRAKLSARRKERGWRYSFDAIDGKATATPATFREFHFLAIAAAFADLEVGTPCTLDVHGLYPAPRVCFRSASVNNGEEHPYSQLHDEIAECHRCAPDAFAWLTSAEFFNLCTILDWPWERAMETVLGEAQETVILFPWLTLTPALVWRVACILQGEASVLGYKGMWYVADTMLSRRQRGDSWEEILPAYYGWQEPPGEAAMRIADTMVSNPWSPSGRVYAYSEADREKMGWRRGDFVYGKGDWLLHFSADWPGNQKIGS